MVPGGTVDGQLQRVAVDPPRRLDPPVRAVVLGLRPGDPAAGPRLHTEVAVRRAAVVEQPDPGDVAVQERDDRSLGVVVERLERRSVRSDPVPPLPHRRRAAVDHVQPGRHRVGEQQLVGDVERGRCRRAPAAGTGVARKPVARCVPAARISSTRRRRGSGAQLRGHELERERANVVGLGVGRAARPSGPMNSACQASRTRSASSAVARRVRASRPMHRGDLAHQPRRVREVRGRDVGLVGAPERLELVRSLQVLAGHEPLAPVKARVPQVALVRQRLGPARWPARDAARPRPPRSTYDSHATIDGHCSSSRRRSP